jgi:SET domain-containing protein
MLVVKTKIGPSTIPGAEIGLFADQFIPKGTQIMDCNSNFVISFTDEQIANMTDLQKTFLIHYGFRPTTNDFVNPGVMRCSLDNDRFMNHSETPNSYDNGKGTWAGRDINPGEEILIDYRAVGCDMSEFS